VQVAPARSDAFQPWRELSVTPTYLERVIHALRRWRYDIVPIGAIPARLAEAGPATRIAALTFDGGTRDLHTHAYPVLKRLGVPFTLYVPGSYPDGLGVLWKQALAIIVGQQPRIGVMLDQEEHRFVCATAAQKLVVCHTLARRMRALADAEAFEHAVRDLCARYDVNLEMLARKQALDWNCLHDMATDPLVTLGAATLSGLPLAMMPAARAASEMRMGQAVLESALGRRPEHVAFPGEPDEAGDPSARHLARMNGYSTAVTCEHRPLRRTDAAQPLALPRLHMDGRIQSVGYLRASLAGWNARPHPAAIMAVDTLTDPGGTSS
jgi:peptidoglycan/xylan/chitin deacetylase (PgdA/CDA1 family)